MAADLTVDDVTDAEIAMNEAAAALAATLPAADIEPPPPHKAAANFAAKRRPHETRQALVRTPSRRDLVTTSRKAQVFAVTATMAMVEVQSRNVLGMLLASSITMVACRTYAGAGKGVLGVSGAAVVVALALSTLWVMRKTTKTIEEMDEYAKKFEQARIEHLDELHGDALGPAPFALVEPVRQPDEAATVGLLVAKAHLLKGRFRDHVMLVLSESVVISEALGPNVKGLERAHEKVKLDYGGDARLLKDVLRCSIICSSMPLLCACYVRLQELEAQGVVQILKVRGEGPTARTRESPASLTPDLCAPAPGLTPKVKNRFRAGAAAGGYMDVNLCVLYEGMVCEIQARGVKQAAWGGQPLFE